MKRGIKLLILVLVLALLGGGYLLISKMDLEEETAESDSSAEEAYEILSIPSGDVEEMSWVLQDNDSVYSFRNLGEIWEYIPDTSLELDNDYMNTLVGIFATFNAYRELEMPEDISTYGLDEPYLTVTLKTDDGCEYTFTFGDMTSVSGRRYCTIGDGKVYTVSSSIATSFNYDLGDLVNLGE